MSTPRVFKCLFFISLCLLTTVRTTTIHAWGTAGLLATYSADSGCSVNVYYGELTIGEIGDLCMITVGCWAIAFQGYVDEATTTTTTTLSNTYLCVTNVGDDATTTATTITGYTIMNNPFNVNAVNAFGLLNLPTPILDNYSCQYHATNSLGISSLGAASLACLSTSDCWGIEYYGHLSSSSSTSDTTGNVRLCTGILAQVTANISTTIMLAQQTANVWGSSLTSTFVLQSTTCQTYREYSSSLLSSVMDLCLSTPTCWSIVFAANTLPVTLTTNDYVTTTTMDVWMCLGADTVGVTTQNTAFTMIASPFGVPTAAEAFFGLPAQVYPAYSCSSISSNLGSTSLSSASTSCLSTSGCWGIQYTGTLSSSSTVSLSGEFMLCSGTIGNFASDSSKSVMVVPQSANVWGSALTSTPVLQSLSCSSQYRLYSSTSLSALSDLCLRTPRCWSVVFTNDILPTDMTETYLTTMSQNVYMCLDVAETTNVVIGDTMILRPFGSPQTANVFGVLNLPASIVPSYACSSTSSNLGDVTLSYASAQCLSTRGCWGVQYTGTLTSSSTGATSGVMMLCSGTIGQLSPDSSKSVVIAPETVAAWGSSMVSSIVIQSIECSDSVLYSPSSPSSSSYLAAADLCSSTSGCWAILLQGGYTSAELLTGASGTVSASSNLYMCMGTPGTTTTVSASFTMMANPTASVSALGDPSFSGFDGSTYQVHGMSMTSYNIFSASWSSSSSLTTEIELHGLFTFLNAHNSHNHENIRHRHHIHNHHNHHNRNHNHRDDQEMNHDQQQLHHRHSTHHHEQRPHDYHNHKHQNQDSNMLPMTKRISHPGNYISRYTLRIRESSSSSSLSSSSFDLPSLACSKVSIEAGAFVNGFRSILVSSCSELASASPLSSLLLRTDIVERVISPSLKISFSKYTVLVNAMHVNFTIVNSDEFLNLSSFEVADDQLHAVSSTRTSTSNSFCSKAGGLLGTSLCGRKAVIEMIKHIDDQIAIAE